MQALHFIEGEKENRREFPQNYPGNQNEMLKPPHHQPQEMGVGGLLPKLSQKTIH